MFMNWSPSILPITRPQCYIEFETVDLVLPLLQSGVEGRTPHVYSVAGVAHHRLHHDIGLLNQAILVSGESGSGKASFEGFCYIKSLILVITFYPLFGSQNFPINGF